MVRLPGLRQEPDRSLGNDDRARLVDRTVRIVEHDREDEGLKGALQAQRVDAGQQLAALVRARRGELAPELRGRREPPATAASSAPRT
jgi:hypothetical protein